jgi:hypothetical protein
VADFSSHPKFLFLEQDALYETPLFCTKHGPGPPGGGPFPQFFTRLAPTLPKVENTGSFDKPFFESEILAQMEDCAFFYLPI